MCEHTADHGSFIKKEFLFMPFKEDIHTVDIGIFPARGRYFRKEMCRMGDHYFRTDVLLPEGRSFYHFFFNGNYEQPHNSEQSVISPYDAQKRAPVVVGSQVFFPLEFRNEPNFISHIKDDVWEIRAITHQAWIQSVELVTGTSAFPLRLAFSENNNGYWFIRLPLGAKELIYTIRISGDGQQKYLSSGHTFVNTLAEADLFVYPLERTAGERRLMLTAGYQILPDRWHRSRPDSDGKTAAWHPGAGGTRIMGGDLCGIVEKLRYLADMRFDFIYLNPVFTAKSYHRYDCTDYMSIDPALGNEDDFRRLVHEAHRWGIKVILDISLNHCSTDFPAFRDRMEKGDGSDYGDWFCGQAEGQMPDPPAGQMPDLPAGRDMAYSGWHGHADLPQFNLEHKAVRAYFRKVARYWPENFGIDGWRLDTGTELPAAFVDEFVSASREVNPSMLVIAESWQGYSKDLTVSGNVDGITNFALYWDILIPFFEKERLSIGKLAMSIMDMLGRNSFRVNRCSWSFVSNHDVPRFFSLLRQKEYYRLAFVLLYALPGTPVVYYGEETYMEGLGDPLNRKCMQFGGPDHLMKDCLRELNRLRNEYFDLFAYGGIEMDTPDGGERLLVISRVLPGKCLQFCMNFGEGGYGVNVLYAEPGEKTRSIYAC